MAAVTTMDIGTIIDYAARAAFVAGTRSEVVVQETYPLLHAEVTGTLDLVGTQASIAVNQIGGWTFLVFNDPDGGPQIIDDHRDPDLTRDHILEFYQKAIADLQ